MGTGEVRFLSLSFRFVFACPNQKSSLISVIDDNDGGTEGGYPKPPPLPIPSMIDIYTPAEAKTRKGFDGQSYELVFSDEFEVDGRSFYKGAFGFFFFYLGLSSSFWEGVLDLFSF